MNKARNSENRQHLLFEEEPLEKYEQKKNIVSRIVCARGGNTVSTSLSTESKQASLASLFDLAWLRQKKRPRLSSPRSELRIADFFCGCGGMSLGLEEAARAVGCEAQSVFANDVEKLYLDVYRKNFRPVFTSNESISNIIDREIGQSLSGRERTLKKQIKSLSVLAGGPPCQGHSDLNNYTRRADPKNSLYLKMARAAQVLEPEHVVIENVPGVRHDKTHVMQRTMEALSKLGYGVDFAVINAHDIGVAQRRQRIFVVASKTISLGSGTLSAHLRHMKQPPRSVGWACEDLLGLSGTNDFDGYSSLSPESVRRVDWLFDNNEYDLPDRYRPRCHSAKAHTYKSVYGRLYWDRPAWTITTGFPVMGQGRFIHPLERRGITVHEAARLQFFPDFFDFGTQTRKSYAKMIGNAVPPKMAYVVGLFLFR